MELREKKIQSEAIFDGQVLHVRRDTVELPDGHPATREHILHVGAVAVLALTDTNEVILERQYRYPFHDILTEIPAGKLNSREEDPLSAAKRELAEETGIHAKKWRRLGDFYGSASGCNFFWRKICLGVRRIRMRMNFWRCFKCR